MLLGIVMRSKINLTFALICCSLLIVFSLSLPNNLGPVSLVSAQDNSIPPTSSKFVPYDGSKYGFSITYPENWKISEDPSGVWFSSPVDETGNIRIESQPAQNLSLSDLVQIQMLQTKDSNKEFKIVSSNMTTLDENPANRTDYKFKVEVPKLLGADLFDYDAIRISALKNDTLHTVTYFATPDTFYIFLPVVQKMLDTLKIIEPTIKLPAV